MIVIVVIWVTCPQIPTTMTKNDWSWLQLHVWPMGRIGRRGRSRSSSFGGRTWSRSNRLFLAVIMIKFICKLLPLDMFNCKLNGKIVFSSCFKGYWCPCYKNNSMSHHFYRWYKKPNAIMVEVTFKNLLYQQDG